MGTDDLLKKRRADRKQRRHEIKTPKANSYAKRRMVDFKSNKNKPSEYDPGTMVYKLVEELKSYLDE